MVVIIIMNVNVVSTMSYVLTTQSGTLPTPVYDPLLPMSRTLEGVMILGDVHHRVWEGCYFQPPRRGASDDPTPEVVVGKGS